MVQESKVKTYDISSSLDIFNLLGGTNKGRRIFSEVTRGTTSIHIKGSKISNTTNYKYTLVFSKGSFYRIGLHFKDKTITIPNVLLISNHGPLIRIALKVNIYTYKETYTTRIKFFTKY